MVLGLMLLVGACSGGSGSPSVSDVYMPQPGVGGPGAFYMTINGGPSDDTVVGASSPACDDMEMHEAVEGDDGMMMMESVERIEIPSGSEVELEPGGLHLMCLQPTDVAVGDTVPLTINFADADDLEIEATIEER